MKIGITHIFTIKFPEKQFTHQKSCFTTYFYFIGIEAVSKKVKKFLKNNSKKVCVNEKDVVTLHSQNGNGASRMRLTRKKFCKEQAH